MRSTLPVAWLTTLKHFFGGTATTPRPEATTAVASQTSDSGDLAALKSEFHEFVRQYKMYQQDIAVALDRIKADLVSSAQVTHDECTRMLNEQQALLAQTLFTSAITATPTAADLEKKAEVIRELLAPQRDFRAFLQQYRTYQNDLANALDRLKVDLTGAIRATQDDCTKMIHDQRALLSDTLAAAAATPQAGAARLPERVRKYEATRDMYEEGLAYLRQAFPHAYAQWFPLLSVNGEAYEGLPEDSCSMAGHPAARSFGAFIRPYLKGHVLDLGCGPQPVPSYLTHYPAERIAGVDPLLPQEPHPFEFVRGFGELLPWADGTFAAVVAATSLDHVLSPTRTFEEIVRVLTPDGVFLAWVGFIEGVAHYDPHDPDIKPIDKYHLFHYSQALFEQLIAPHFVIREKLSFDRQSYFYALRPKTAPA